MLDGAREPEGDAQRFGSATHCRLLEPERYAREYHVAERCGAVLASGRNEGQRCRSQGTVLLPASVEVEQEFGRWRCGTHPHVEAIVPERFVTADEAANIETLRDRLLSHDVVRLFR